MGQDCAVAHPGPGELLGTSTRGCESLKAFAGDSLLLTLVVMGITPTCWGNRSWCRSSRASTSCRSR